MKNFEYQTNLNQSVDRIATSTSMMPDIMPNIRMRNQHNKLRNIGNQITSSKGMHALILDQ